MSQLQNSFSIQTMYVLYLGDTFKAIEKLFKFETMYIMSKKAWWLLSNKFIVENISLIDFLVIGLEWFFPTSILGPIVWIISERMKVTWNLPILHVTGSFALIWSVYARNLKHFRVWKTTDDKQENKEMKYFCPLNCFLSNEAK